MNTITQSIRRLVRVLCPFLLVFLSFTAVAQTKGITLNLNDVPLRLTCKVPCLSYPKIL